MLLSVTDAAKVAGCARSTIYEKINNGQLSRSAGGKIDTAELQRVFGELQTPEQHQSNDISDNTDKSDTMASELLDMYQAKDSELAEVRAELDETKARLTEHREAARSLMSPDDFDAKLSEALQKERAQQDLQAKKWQTALSERQDEIKQARQEADTIRQREQQTRAEADEIRQREAAQAKTLKAERDRIAALESRGFIARLLNKKPEPIG